MTPADFEQDVQAALRYIRKRVPEGRCIPRPWTRHCQGLVARNVLARIDPESRWAEAMFAAMGRLGLVVAE